MTKQWNKRLIYILMLALLVGSLFHMQHNAEAADNGYLYIRVNGQQLKMRLADTGAARDLKNMVSHGDITITTSDNRFEQYGSLNQKLSTNDSYINAKANDVLLYNSQYICFFYGENSYSYTRIGWIEDVELARLKEILSGGTLTMTISSTSWAGWIKSAGKWYFYENGSAKHGWLKDAGKWYYLNKTGAMVTGWQKIDGKWYYFSGGAMVTGWKKIDGKWYYFSSGAMVTGWKKIDGKWYYFSGGAMTTGWMKYNNKWYYFNSAGAMVTGTQTIGNVKYVFDANGVWLR